VNTLIQPAPMARVARQLRRAASDFDAHAAVFESVGNRLRERLELLAVVPRRVLDLGCRSGYQLETLRERYPEASVVGADPAPGGAALPPSSWPAWLRRRPRPAPRVAADPHRLPFADGAFDLVVSNLLLPWCHAPHAVFAEVVRVLAPGGAFLFTSTGPDTLREYRAVWARIDAHLHGFGLVDMHDLGDAMLAAGFAAPVLDRDEIRVDYPSIDALQEELRRVGAANVALGRRVGLMSPSVRKALRVGAGELVADSATEADEAAAGVAERFPVTLELVQGHAWRGELATSRRGPEGERYVSLESLRGSRAGRDGGG